MLAYHNDQALKKCVISQMAAHRKADELVQGYGYWEDGKGCAVGCLIKGSDHSLYETQFGIPQMLARLEDCIFEGLPKKDAKKWPERFLGAITPGADLALVGWKFLYWNLTENLVFKDSDDTSIQKVINQCRAAIKQCGEAICPLTKGELCDKKTAESAWSAAWSAAESAWSAAESARSAARSAAWSAAESAWSAAESAARSAAWSAAESARSAARSAAWSAAESAWSAAWSAAESAAWIKMADKLIELLENAA